MDRLRQFAPLAALLLALTGCTTAAEATAGTVTGSRPTAAVTADGPKPAPGRADVDEPRTGPAVPKPGTWYPYDLYTHCGIGTLTFGGKYWELRQMRTDIDAEVAGPRVEWGDLYTPGYIQLESAEMVVFETGGQPPLTFVPVAAPTTLCK
ncbi:hypothetical protein LG634_34995 [Streptomyces bambusae]|uniref:hypothetical protein n=1 Tax=Streptomyces bambusae TaxID=1550616 RepID=UPI001CFFED5D|nr:hypothetical protein [Streptomyces bambusae]MCB5169997.1 hypothetical protein [Streptomyces bambusae]